MEQSNMNQTAVPVKKKSSFMLYFATFLLSAVIFTSIGFGVGYFVFNNEETSKNTDENTSSQKTNADQNVNTTENDTDTTTNTTEKLLTYTNSQYPTLSIEYPESWNKKEGTDYVSFSKQDYVLKYTFGQPGSTADGGHADCYEASEVSYEKVNNTLTRVSKFKTNNYLNAAYHFGKIYEVDSQLAELQKEFSAYNFPKSYSSYKICAYDFPSAFILITNSDLYSYVGIEVSYDEKGELLTEADEIVSTTVYK